ncbi:hypothetical protein DSO57_1018510 [Entomophthora muscae]|uniref:Uncharacterized protein n=2 Tax=Entomophthora muscae TaxID=34485 RepID=A0ACC2SGZ6_9FUNG|nr:hypothetical protein DSO57_1018510 [Entomophthora muscae]
MIDIFWYAVSFTLGGIVAAPIFLTYGFFLLQRYIKEPDPEPEKLLEASEEEFDSCNSENIVVSKVGWIRIAHQEKSASESNSNIADMITNGFNSLLDRKHPVPLRRGKDSCYAVLKQDKLMVYESGNRVECRGVILLSEFTPSIFPEGLPDNEAFKKEYPILLKHRLIEDAEDDISSDYYLYLDSPVEKESWFIALLNAANPRPENRQFDPLSFDRSAIEGLIKTINSNDDHHQTQWLNALIGRIFLGVYKTQAAKDYFINKIATKTTKVKKPGFLGEIHVRDLRIGNSIPYITNPKLLNLSKDGELTAEMDLEYTGGFKAEIETEATLSVTSRLKPLKVNMVLAVVLKSFTGKILLRVKPPPTNRFWIGFYEMPKMSMSIEPMVSDTQIKSTMIIQAIERRICEMVKEALVLPNMDDFCFFPSFGTGGIFNFSENPLDSVPESDSEDDKSTPEEGKQDEITAFPDEVDVPEINIVNSLDSPGSESPIPSSKNIPSSKPTQATTLNEKLRSLKENYFGGRRQKPNKDGATSPVIPGSPASMSMPNLLAGIDSRKASSASSSPKLLPLDPADVDPSELSPITLDPAPRASSDFFSGASSELSAPPAAMMSPSNSNDSTSIRKRRIIPSFGRLKEHLNVSSFGSSSNPRSPSSQPRDSPVAFPSPRD